MTTARPGRLTPLSAVDETGRERPIVPFRRAAHSGHDLLYADAFGPNSAMGASEARSSEPGRDAAPASRRPAVENLDLGSAVEAPTVVAAVERFLAEAAVERRRLRAEIDAANARTARAQATLSVRRREAESELGALALAAQDEMAELERAHEATVRRIREDARAEASQILEAARSHTASMTESAAELVRLLGLQPHDARRLREPPRVRS